MTYEGEQEKDNPMWQPPTNFIINISRQEGGGC